MSINFQELRELLSAISQSDITELILKNDDFELTVRKEKSVVTNQMPAVTPQVIATTTGGADTTTVTISEPATQAPSTPTVDDKKWVDITSPMVGTFYAAPSPDDDPFVTSGDRINQGDTVCIIEAMKLMNEIEAEVSGQIMEITAQNGEPVEFGQVLMRVNPG